MDAEQGKKKQERQMSEEECLEMLAAYGTPAHVVRHCREVTRVALAMAQAMNENGCEFRLDMLQTAGLLHDIARVEERHWEVGADLVEEKGYPDAARLIRHHMTHTTDPRDKIEEQDILCLADRMVKEDQYVGLEERMRYVMEKYRDQKEIYDRIHSKMCLNRDLRSRIEGKIGKSLDDLLGNA